MYRGLMLLRRSKTVSNVTFSSLCSREPDEHSAEPWWPLWSEPELSCGRTSRLQLQQPRQQHTGISFWTWAAETRTFSLFWLCWIWLCCCDVCLSLSPFLFAAADYLSTLSMSSTSLGSDSELTGMDSTLWGSAGELRRVDSKGTLFKVRPLCFLTACKYSPTWSPAPLQ